MFFTTAGRVIAWFLVVTGALRVAMGLSIAFIESQSMSPRYFGTRSTGEAIEGGLFWLMIGVALGIASEISRAVAAKTDS